MTNPLMSFLLSAIFHQSSESVFLKQQSTRNITTSVSLFRFLVSFISEISIVKKDPVFDTDGLIRLTISEKVTSEPNPALLRLAMKILADLNIHKTMYLLLQNSYVKLFYHYINVILNETV